MGMAIQNLGIIELDYKNVLSGFEELITCWGKDVTLTLDTKPIVAGYLQRKYLFSSKNPSFFCPAGTRNIYIKPNGVIYPCKLFPASSNSFCDLQQLITTNKKEMLQNCIHGGLDYKPSICEKCIFKESCEPCPLLSHDRNENECTIAMNYFNQYEKDFLNKRIIYISNSEFRISERGKILVFGDRNFKFSDLGLLIWNNLSTQFKINDLILKITSIEPNLSKDEIINFVNRLRRLKLILVEDDFPKRLPIHCKVICCAR